MKILSALALTAVALSPAIAQAQDSSRTHELYHIFDFKTSARRAEMIKALQDGLNPNISKSDTTTPIVMGPLPETPGRFRIVDPFENSKFPLAAMIPAAQRAQTKQAQCDGAVWISSALRRINGAQQLRLTMCLFPYTQGYQLDVYAIDVKERGGGLSQRLGRAVAEAIVGDTDAWTNKTIVDAVRSVRRGTGAKVTYVEGQPEFAGTPWEDAGQLLPSAGDKATTEEAPRPTPER